MARDRYLQMISSGFRYPTQPGEVFLVGGFELCERTLRIEVSTGCVKRIYFGDSDGGHSNLAGPLCSASTVTLRRCPKQIAISSSFVVKNLALCCQFLSLTTGGFSVKSKRSQAYRWQANEAARLVPRIKIRRER